MNLPAINFRRTYLVARRDYLGYVKTWGFWISFFLPFVFGLLGYFASTWDIDIEPTRYEAILDETGQHKAAMQSLYALEVKENERQVVSGIAGLILNEAENERFMSVYDAQGLDAALPLFEEKYPGLSKRLNIPEPKFIFVEPQTDNLESLKALVNREGTVSYNGKDVELSGVLHLYVEDGRIVSNHWSTLINSIAVKQFYTKYFRELAVDRYLESGGLDRDGLAEAQKIFSPIASFDPSKSLEDETGSQKVGDADMIPYAVAAILTIFLWLTIFSGSYMLLTSMLEEKLNKLLEMMLASTRLSEIIFGKLLGVAALTVTAMIPYFAIGGFAVVFILLTGDADVVAALTSTFTAKTLVFFPVFLLLGYIFYGAFFYRTRHVGEFHARRANADDTNYADLECMRTRGAAGRLNTAFADPDGCQLVPIERAVCCDYAFTL